MKALMFVPVLALFAWMPAGSADAKPGGCLKGAAVGGVAGHYAGRHGVLGAVAGCAIGARKRSNYNKEQQQMQGQPRS